MWFLGNKATLTAIFNSYQKKKKELVIKTLIRLLIVSDLLFNLTHLTILYKLRLP